MLSAQVQSREIDGVTYHVLPLPTGLSILVAGKVLRMAAGAFSDISSLVAAAKAVTSALEALASGLVADLDPEVVLFAAKAFAGSTQYEIGSAKLPLVSEQADHFDEHFRGRFLSMLKWLSFAAGVTYPFVASVTAKAATATVAPAAATPAPGAPAGG